MAIIIYDSRQDQQNRYTTKASRQKQQTCKLQTFHETTIDAFLNNVYDIPTTVLYSPSVHCSLLSIVYEVAGDVGETNDPLFLNRISQLILSYDI